MQHWSTGGRGWLEITIEFIMLGIQSVFNFLLKGGNSMWQQNRVTRGEKAGKVL